MNDAELLRLVGQGTDLLRLSRELMAKKEAENRQLLAALKQSIALNEQLIDRLGLGLVRYVLAHGKGGG